MINMAGIDAQIILNKNGVHGERSKELEGHLERVELLRRKKQTLMNPLSYTRRGDRYVKLS